MSVSPSRRAVFPMISGSASAIPKHLRASGSAIKRGVHLPRGAPVGRERRPMLASKERAKAATRAGEGGQQQGVRLGRAP
jgi:hypothetical protein